jgi:hypothetical protein
MEITMHRSRTFILVVLMSLFAMAARPRTAANPVDRWAAAAGGRDKLVKVTALYREATLQVRGFEGTLKAWHTAEGRYRKEERVATYSSVETFDGTTASVQLGDAPPRALTGADLERARSSAFANANAIFFVFSPDRRRGAVVVEDENTIVMKPEGGIDWTVMLDKNTGLPAKMVHTENDRAVTVAFTEYETVDGIMLEREIHRSNGDPRFDAVIRFTKTVVNPSIDPSLFSIASPSVQ